MITEAFYEFTMFRVKISNIKYIKLRETNIHFIRFILLQNEHIFITRIQ